MSLVEKDQPEEPVEDAADDWDIVASRRRITK